MMTASPPSTPAAKRRDLRFIIIGAGMAGILSAVRLKEAGFDNIVVYEKADRLGGTWRENTYPGIACDVPSHLYSYSFALNPEWSQQFAPGPEIRNYFEDVARRFEIAPLIRYNREITRCELVEGRWRVEASDASTDVGDFVVAATGVLHHPAMPDFAGLDSFAGAAFHSARWDHDVALEGKRVGVVGTGSSAIQIVSALVDQVRELTLFQRTAQWVIAVQNSVYGEADKARFRADAAAIEEIRALVSAAFIDGFANVLGDMHSPVLEAMHAACEANLDASVKDPELRERLRPSYRAGCKRLVMSGGFYDAIQRPNAKLVTEGIEVIEPAGVRTRDGRLHELDVLVLATGFRVDRFMRPMRLIGRHGVTLEDAWRDNPSAYLAIAMPDFPNFFMLNGPNGPVGNFSLIDVAELQFGYILQLVDQVRSGACKEVSVSRSAAERFDAERLEAAKTTIWNSGCTSWYLDSNGVPTAWPWTFDRFRQEMAAPRLGDFEMR